MTDLAVGPYKMMIGPQISHYVFFSRTVQFMSVEQLISDFNARGLEYVMINQPASIPRQEIAQAPAQPMRTRLNKKKNKEELRSKRNQDRQSKRQEDPPIEMNPPAQKLLKVKESNAL